MEHLKNILVYVTTEAAEHPAVARAQKLASDHGAALSIASSIDATPWWTDKLLSGLAQKWQAKFVEESDKKLEEMAAPLRADGLSVATKTVIGRAWHELIREVLRNNHDLVIKDIDSDVGLFHHDIDCHLLRKCPCPVWLVHRDAKQFRKIAAAIDLVPGDEEKKAFNGKILEFAATLAKEGNCDLHVIRSWSLYGESVLKSHMPEEEIEQIKNEKRALLKQSIEEFTPQYTEGVANVEIHVPEGPSEYVVPELLEQDDEDLLVMGTIARTGVAGLIIGNTAEKILKRLTCSVLAVKPDGYESPVTLG